MLPEIDLDALAQAASTGGRTRAPLVIWMCEHHDEFAALLDRQGVNWNRIATFFSENGYAGAGGQPLTPRTVRSYWGRARKLIAQRRAREHDQPATTDECQALGGTAAPTEPAAPAAPKFQPSWMRNEGRGVSAAERQALGDPTAPADPEVKPEPRFKPVRLRNGGRGVSAAERRALGDPTAPADPADPKWRGDKSR